MDEFLNKTYKLTHSEKFEEYLKFVDVGIVVRKMVLAMSATSTLVKNDDGSYSFIFTAPLKNVIIKFELGKEFTEVKPDGSKMKSVIRWDEAGRELIQTQIEESGRKQTHIRKFTADKMTIITTVEGWDGKCIREFELVN